MCVLLASNTVSGVDSAIPSDQNNKKLCRNHRAPWTIQEMDYVEKNYSDMSCADIGQHLGRTVNAIRGMAQKLGCAPSKTADWTDMEIDILRTTYASDLEIEDISKMLKGRTPVSVALKARNSGLTRPEPFWQSDELETLSLWYPTEGKDVATRLPRRNEESVKIKAAKLGIKFQGREQYRVWTDVEWDLLAENLHLPFTLLCEFFPNRSRKSVEFALWKFRKKKKAEKHR